MTGTERERERRDIYIYKWTSEMIRTVVEHHFRKKNMELNLRYKEEKNVSVIFFLNKSNHSTIDKGNTFSNYLSIRGTHYLY